MRVSPVVTHFWVPTYKIIKYKKKISRKEASKEFGDESSSNGIWVPIKRVPPMSLEMRVPPKEVPGVGVPPMGLNLF